MQFSLAELEAVFGEDSSGETPEDRALTSSRIFVRGQAQIAFATDSAKGRKLSAIEALGAFGWEIISNLAYRTATPIICMEGEPGSTIKKRRESLGLTIESLAKVAGIEPAILQNLENATSGVPIRQIENVARLLALDETHLSIHAGANGDHALGVRLREMVGPASQDTTHFSPAMVLGLSEAAWVIKKQTELQNAAESYRKLGFVPDQNYDYPAWRSGMRLAAKTREKLGLAVDDPIRGFKDLVENVLGVPVIQAELNPRFAGATIANGKTRGIVLNLRGHNENVWVRRNTLAHELCHLLYDPGQRLAQLLVDEFETIETDPFSISKVRDVVEIRANAFAAEFLAPQEAVKTVFMGYQSHGEGLIAVMETYGISFTSAKWQVANALKINPSDIDASGVNISPSAEWAAGENFTADYFPIESAPICRRGRFAYVLIKAVESGSITSDTAAASLGCDEKEFLEKMQSVRDVFV
jgi:Zn-dependent peptidase ImmA (M78 family)/transcriptional regulator with XRE-family HTH domain